MACVAGNDLIEVHPQQCAPITSSTTTTTTTTTTTKSESNTKIVKRHYNTVCTVCAVISSIYLFILYITIVSLFNRPVQNGSLNCGYNTLHVACALYLFIYYSYLLLVSRPIRLISVRHREEISDVIVQTDARVSGAISVTSELCLSVSGLSKDKKVVQSVSQQ